MAGSRAKMIASKADVAIVQDPDGSFHVRPGTFIVESSSKKVTFRNYTGQDAVLVFPKGQDTITKVLTAFQRDAGGNDKQDVTLTAAFEAGVHRYHVYIGDAEAHGNSDPSIIVD